MDWSCEITWRSDVTSVSHTILPRAVCFATSHPANHAICSYIDLSGYASGPIRIYLFIDYIITNLIFYKIKERLQKNCFLLLSRLMLQGYVCLPAATFNLSSADNLFKQFGPRSGPIKCLAWSGSKPFDTDSIPERIFWKSESRKKSANKQKIMKNYPAYKELQKNLENSTLIFQNTC